jgi:hypothetical protein
MPEHLVALDLDHTCLHHQGLLEVVENFGSQTEVEPGRTSRYLASSAIKFTIDSFLDAIGRPDKVHDFETTLMEQFASSYYQDVIPFLQWARSKSTLVIITRGADPKLQNLKASYVRHLVDDVLIANRIGAKGKLLKQHYGQSRSITLIDDRLDELEAAEDELRNATPSLRLYQMVRPDATHPQTGHYPTITSLEEIKEPLQ